MITKQEMELFAEEIVEVTNNLKRRVKMARRIKIDLGTVNLQGVEVSQKKTFTTFSKDKKVAHLRGTNLRLSEHV